MRQASLPEVNKILASLGCRKPTKPEYPRADCRSLQKSSLAPFVGVRRGGDDARAEGWHEDDR